MIDIGLPKILAALALIALVIGVPAYAMHERRRAVAAEAQAASLGESLVAQMQNADAVAALMAEAAEKDRKRTARIQTLEAEVRNAKIPVPKECVPALMPLQRSLDGLRTLRSEAGGAPPPGPRVLARP